MVDAGIGCFAIKYQYKQERPITFIRGILGYTTWNSLVNTPNFPDFISAHSSNAGAFVEIMEEFFGYHYGFTDNTYDYLGMPSRTYDSFNALGIDIGNARLYGGIHNRFSCEQGLKMGRIVGQNVNKTIKFLK